MVTFTDWLLGHGDAESLKGPILTALIGAPVYFGFIKSGSLGLGDGFAVLIIGYPTLRLIRGSYWLWRGAVMDAAIRRRDADTARLVIASIYRWHPDTIHARFSARNMVVLDDGPGLVTDLLLEDMDGPLTPVP